MTNTVIKIENLSKQYRLGKVGTGTLSHDLNRWLAKVRGKEDPFLKIGETNDRSQKGNSDYVWALRDINFEVKQGEVLGIIGKNGAGKSTLLKILSRVTTPTTGEIKVKGRIVSLLEVGTGFHPELTGRENIFLNGAILGMTKREIKKKFDEIVDFSGVEKFIDTPVKRYSSGMYVRLAFAVAAHLDPEILIVDEVLAVGDAEFQRKCLGKMQDVAGQGRTVLFVSHNMISIRKLCVKGILIANGQIEKNDKIAEVIECYLNTNKHCQSEFEFEIPKNDCIAYPLKLIVLDENNQPCNNIPVAAIWKIKLLIKVQEKIKGFAIGIGFRNVDDYTLRNTWTESIDMEPGLYDFTFIEKNIYFGSGQYSFMIGLSSRWRSFYYMEKAAYLNISANSDRTDLIKTTGTNLILNKLEYTIQKLN